MTDTINFTIFISVFITAIINYIAISFMWVFTESIFNVIWAKKVIAEDNKTQRELLEYKYRALSLG